MPLELPLGPGGVEAAGLAGHAAIAQVGPHQLDAVHNFHHGRWRLRRGGRARRLLRSVPLCLALCGPTAASGRGFGSSQKAEGYPLIRALVKSKGTVCSGPLPVPSP